LARSADAIASGTIAVASLILVVIAAPTKCAGEPRPAAEASPVAPASSIAGHGVTLDSVSVKFPPSDRTFPGGAEADAINKNCLICHSAGMVLTQPALSRSDWQDEVNKMLDFYKAPIPSKDVPAIVDYLANLRSETAHLMSHQPDAEHGAVIVAQGTATGAPACALCHAFNGASDGSGAFPRLAGQSDYYLTKELGDYASGIRSNAIMSPIAKALSPDDVADVSAYYSRIDAPFPQLQAPDPALVRRGGELAKTGDEAKGIESCDRCHGPGGIGEPPAIPYLAGQYAHYISHTLRMWQEGYRKTSSADMAVTAHKFDEHENAAVAAYYQQARSDSASKTREAQGNH